MPMSDSDSRFTFVFDSHGRMRLENTDKALEFLDLVDKNADEKKEIQMVLGAQASPPNLVNCGEGKAPMPLRVTGCLNEICPTSIRLKLTPLIQEEWTRTMIERGGGPA